jgi:predicted RNA-binding Zn ribbon-like protein
VPVRDVMEIRLDGGHVALDFVNTVGGLRNAPPDARDDALETYADLVRWSARVELLSPRQARKLLRAADERSAEARVVLQKALALRALTYDVFRPLAEGRRPAAALLARLRDAEREALAHASLAPSNGSLSWTWTDTQDLAAPLWAITHAAVELLTRGPLERLKVCGNCRWLFLDRSRNRSRRWCSMDECGTSLKKERFVERRRKQRRATTQASQN